MYIRFESPVRDAESRTNLGIFQTAGLCLRQTPADARGWHHAELRREFLEWPGFGAYAADNFLRSLGRLEHLGLDSMIRRRWKELYPRARATESAINRRLARYGIYRGLALWLLVSARWYDAN